MYYKNHWRGFTIIELIIAISIIAVLSMLVAYNVNEYQKKARDAKRKADMQTYS